MPASRAQQALQHSGHTLAEERKRRLSAPSAKVEQFQLRPRALTPAGAVPLERRSPHPEHSRLAGRPRSYSALGAKRGRRRRSSQARVGACAHTLAAH
eukprot:scaffold639_cov304-Pinguiococcus_pyrenoidosus.AAC.8